MFALETAMTYRVSIVFFPNSKTMFSKTIDYIIDGENEFEASNDAKKRLMFYLPTAVIRTVN
jgi:hypothetical protein